MSGEQLQIACSAAPLAAPMGLAVRTNMASTKSNCTELLCHLQDLCVSLPAAHSKPAPCDGLIRLGKTKEHCALQRRLQHTRPLPTQPATGGPPCPAPIVGSQKVWCTLWPVAPACMRVPGPAGWATMQATAGCDVVGRQTCVGCGMRKQQHLDKPGTTCGPRNALRICATSRVQRPHLERGGGDRHERRHVVHRHLEAAKGGEVQHQ